MKNETKAIHLNFGQGTNFDIKVPWVVGKSSFTTNIAGTFMMLDATTNMDYRKLLHCETLEMNLAMKYSLAWNAYQQWLFKFTWSKASMCFIYAHQWFFQVKACSDVAVSINSRYCIYFP